VSGIPEGWVCVWLVQSAGGECIGRRDNLVIGWGSKQEKMKTEGESR
jgi:hypothetical protein